MHVNPVDHHRRAETMDFVMEPIHTKIEEFDFENEARREKERESIKFDTFCNIEHALRSVTLPLDKEI